MAIKKEKIDQSDKGSAKAVSSEKHSSPPKLSHMEKDTSGNHAKPSLMSGKHKPSWKVCVFNIIVYSYCRDPYSQ